MLYLCFAQSFRRSCLHPLFPWHRRFPSMATYQQTPTPHRLQSARHDCCPVANPEYICKGLILYLCGAFPQIFYPRSEQWLDPLNGSVAPSLPSPDIWIVARLYLVFTECVTPHISLMQHTACAHVPSLCLGFSQEICPVLLPKVLPSLLRCCGCSGAVAELP